MIERRPTSERVGSTGAGSALMEDQEKLEIGKAGCGLRRKFDATLNNGWWLVY